MRDWTSAPNGVEACSQKVWDSKCIQVIADGLMANALSNKDKARLLASQAPLSGDWLFATTITAIGLRSQMKQFAWPLVCDLELDKMSLILARVEVLLMFVVSMVYHVGEVQDATSDTVS